MAPIKPPDVIDWRTLFKKPRSSQRSDVALLQSFAIDKSIKIYRTGLCRNWLTLFTLAEKFSVFTPPPSVRRTKIYSFIKKILLHRIGHSVFLLLYSKEEEKFFSTFNQKTRISRKSFLFHHNSIRVIIHIENHRAKQKESDWTNERRK